MEQELPFSFIKNKKQFIITSLLDKNLGLFDGISTFNSIVSDKLIIKNETEDIYIGGRNGVCKKPFYIGKLIDVEVNGNSIMNNVKSYSFTKIQLANVIPGTIATITHMRTPPHFQMGGMAYINRARKEILKGLK